MLYFSTPLSKGRAIMSMILFYLYSNVSSYPFSTRSLGRGAQPIGSYRSAYLSTYLSIYLSIFIYMHLHLCYIKVLQQEKGSFFHFQLLPHKTKKKKKDTTCAFLRVFLFCLFYRLHPTEIKVPFFKKMRKCCSSPLAFPSKRDPSKHRISDLLSYLKFMESSH
ncbi:hypothetical protein BDF20DRAFT_128790 [Mycotypha africana]|uniref:uncharacterized protein n=1 Tax=Mycotypha africana TaxID=64632 RepID=UPI002301E4F8|nr:uncharacterized protein BDF20DRAFT_128790 [Mycotypha africana]KAI8968843.1 hypothetical protein BDF20DRAFT_128790 [Mycotypha africana]